MSWVTRDLEAIRYRDSLRKAIEWHGARSLCCYGDEDDEEVDEKRGKELWRCASVEGVTHLVVGVGASLAKLWADEATFCESLDREPKHIKKRVLDVALRNDLAGRIDLLLSRGITRGMVRRLIKCGKIGGVYTENLAWLIKGLNQHEMPTSDLKYLARYVDSLLQLYPYIAHCGNELYWHCSREGFEVLRHVHGREDVYLELMVRVYVGFRRSPLRNEIRALVAQGVDCHRARGIALGAHSVWAHWLLLSDDEQRRLAQAYGADYEQACRDTLDPEASPELTFVWKLVHASLHRAIDEQLIESLRPLVDRVEPGVY